MAADLTMLRVICRCAWLLPLLGAVSAAHALEDPTMPPAEINVPGARGAEGNELQSIIISPTRRAAIISGQTVELGGKIGDVRLIEVSAGGVVLEGPKGRQVLTLFPSVRINKKAIAPPIDDDAKRPVREKRAAGEPASPAGKKEEK